MIILRCNYYYQYTNAPMIQFMQFAVQFKIDTMCRYHQVEENNN
jgi:hypothetical protein